MRQPLLHVLAPYAVAALICAAAAVALYRLAPKLLLLLDHLLTLDPIFLGSWLALAAAGADFAVTTVYRKLRFAEVGAKSEAQLRLSREQ